MNLVTRAVKNTTTCVRVCVCMFITLLSGSAPRLKRHMYSRHHCLSLLGASISPPVSLHRVGLLVLGVSSLLHSSLLFITYKKAATDTVMYGIRGDSDNQDNNYTNAQVHPSSSLIT